MATAILSVNVKKCPHFGGIYRLGSFFNTMPMCSIWLQYHPPPGKGTAVKITGQEKEDKVKKSRHHMEFVNKSSNVFFDRAGMTLKFMVVLHGCRCPHMLGHFKIISFVNPKEKFWWWRGLL